MAQIKEVEPGAIAGRNLKKLMKKNHLTQAAFGEQFGCDERTVRNYWKDIDSLKVIKSIADFFGVDYRDMIGGDID